MGWDEVGGTNISENLWLSLVNFNERKEFIFLLPRRSSHGSRKPAGIPGHSCPRRGKGLELNRLLGSNLRC